MVTNFKFYKLKKAFTLAEIIICCALFVIVVGAAYKIFSSEVKSIKVSLEHIEVNENARIFFTKLGNDIRNSNWLDFPVPVFREKVRDLKPIKEGRLCVLRRQGMNFDKNPNENGFLMNGTIEYYLKPSKSGGSDLYRRTTSGDDLTSSKRSEKKICSGIGEVIMFSTATKAIDIKKTGKAGPKNIMFHTPYSLDGTGPYLLHVYATFLRGENESDKASKVVYTLKTCFNVRGKLNGVIP